MLNLDHAYQKINNLFVNNVEECRRSWYCYAHV